MEGEKLIGSIDIGHYMVDEESINLVAPGDLITQEEGYMKYLQKIIKWSWHLSK